nr:polysaccharide biosynthesis C-terminal domain-containing protein [Butyrivibrio sp.]
MQQEDFFEKIREGEEISIREQISMIVLLSIPAIFSQLSTVIMEYVDQSMVGRLGADPSAAIGLISSTTWLVGGLCSAATTGFTVQVAHSVGAKNEPKARALVKHGLVAVFLFSAFIAAVCLAISGVLPVWLGGDESINSGATTYFRIFSMALPVIHLSGAAAGMLQCSGNIKTPSILNIVGCFLNVIFNLLLIFPTREISFGAINMMMPGAGLGIAGAALGTAFSQAVIALMMLYTLMIKSPMLHMRKEKSIPFSSQELSKAVRIAVPV